MNKKYLIGIYEITFGISPITNFWDQLFTQRLWEQ